MRAPNGFTRAALPLVLACAVAATAAPRRAAEQPRAATAPAAIVGVRAGDRMLLVEGRPFFPLGVYEAPGTDSAMRRLARAGFNLVEFPAGSAASLRDALDRLQANGLVAWFTAGELLDFSRDAENRRRRLAALVDSVGDHPALLMWESMDEPVWSEHDADAYLEGYRYLHALDPGRPIWTNHAPRNSVAELARWNRATDIAGADIYPVPEPQRHSDLPDRTLSVVGAECDKNVRAVGGAKPVLMVLQGFGWAELTRAPGGRVSARVPTRAESRFMAWDAIVHGANGLVWWGTSRTARPSRFWSDLQSVVRELADLADVITSESVPDTNVTRLVPAVSRVRLVHKRARGRDWLVLVNERPSAVTVTVRVPRPAAPRLWRLHESAPLPVQAGSVRLRLLGHDVAVLADDPALARPAADFSAEWRRPAPVAPASLLQTPGNLIANPGFELDSNGDLVPDEWETNVPLAVSLVPQARTGRRALALTAMGDDPTPLAVQRGTPFRRGVRYRLSGWYSAPSTAQARLYAERWAGHAYRTAATPWTAGDGTWRRLVVEVQGDSLAGGEAYVVARVRGRGVVRFDDLVLEPRR